MAPFTLTVRHGARVQRERFETLDEAITSLEAQSEAIRADGPLDSVKAFREYGPGQRVAGRVEISTGGFLRGRDAGVDVMGDGSLVPYAGGIRKRMLDANAPFDAIRDELR
ncbi:MAG: hypothetical protein ACR2G3_06755 [Solirubrobacterales bacterium]